MTRTEFLAEERRKFIEEHLRPPRWIAALPSWLGEPLLVLYWVFFKPSALRLHVHRIAPELGDDTNGLLRLRALLYNSSLRRLIFQAFFITFVAYPLGMLVYLVATLTGWPFRGATNVLDNALTLIMFGLAVGGILGVLLNTASGVEGGIALSVALGLIAGLAADNAGSFVTGIAWSTAIGVTGGIVWSIGTGIFFAIVFGTESIPLGVMWGMGTLFGAFRLPFFLFEVRHLLRRERQNTNEPSFGLHQSSIYWDELQFLPRPGLAKLLVAGLKQDLAKGMREVAYLVRYPYQRWVGQRALQELLNEQPNIIFAVIEKLLRWPLPYVVPAVYLTSDERQREADCYYSSKLVLAELGDVYAIRGFSEDLAYRLTSRLRRQGPVSLMNLFRSLYWLMESVISQASLEREINAKQIDVVIERMLDFLKPFRHVAYGEEFYRCFETFHHFLQFRIPEQLAGASQSLEWLKIIEQPLRPDILEILGRLKEISQSVAAYRDATSEVSKHDHLTHARSGIDKVRKMAQEIHEPEATILGLIAQRWYEIVVAAQDTLAIPEVISLLDNFYVAGPPLTPESGRLFVGREDVFREIEELWRNPLQKVPVVLHGQRRMGKTSILYHLQQALGSEYCPVIVDLQGLLPKVKGEPDLWAQLIRTVAKGLRQQGVRVVAREGEDFDAFLDRIEEILGKEHWLALMLDEFEKLEAKIQQGVVPEEFLDYLRHLMQHRPRLLLLLAGHHTLQERQKRYWSPLMGIAKSVKVSYLDEDSARQLIINPWDGFRLNYEEEAIKRLLEATGRQPMLLQLACSAVIDLVNEDLKRTGGSESPLATLATVEAALDRLLTSEEAGHFFHAVWDEWLGEPERIVLSAVAAAYREEEGWVQRETLEGVLPEKELAETLRRLVEERDVLETDGERYRFRVELVRRWVAAHRPVADIVR